MRFATWAAGPSRMWIQSSRTWMHSHPKCGTISQFLASHRLQVLGLLLWSWTGSDAVRSSAAAALPLSCSFVCAGGWRLQTIIPERDVPCSGWLRIQPLLACTLRQVPARFALRPR